MIIVTHIVLLFFVAYVLASINFAIVLFKVLGKEDPRHKFSKNPGATNVYRQAGGLWAAVVLGCDMARAMGMAWVATLAVPVGFVPWIGFGLLLGNRFPLFHQFKGGKGVATYLGFTCFIAPVGALLAVAAWCLTYFGGVSIPFVASFVMVVVAGVGSAVMLGRDGITMTGILISVVFIIWNHRGNITQFIQEKVSRSKSIL